jgi:histidinol-phosphate aminotransferase
MLDPASPPPLRPEFVALPGYEPVEPLEAIARRIGIDPADVLKLDANENPFGMLPAVRDAIAAVTDYAVYPDPLQVELRAAIAAYLDVAAERIVAGAGSDELIEVTIRALVAPGQRILVCPPTFGMYRFVADVQGVVLDEVPRAADFSLDLDAVLQQITDETAAVLLATPNNPTGAVLSDTELRALLATGVTVILDEAYAEFAGASFLSWMGDHPRLIVFRTFSKWAGLAGLRIGYGVFPPTVADVVMRIKQPYSVNRAAEIGALSALDHQAAYAAQIETIVASRNDLSSRIDELPWLSPNPSAANFLLCEVQDGRGKDLRDALEQRGVFVRYYTRPDLLARCIRISMPRPDQLDDLMQRLQAAGRSLGFSD